MLEKLLFWSDPSIVPAVVVSTIIEDSPLLFSVKIAPFDNSSVGVDGDERSDKLDDDDEEATECFSDELLAQKSVFDDNVGDFIVLK